MNILPQPLNALDILNIFIEEHRICSPLDFEADVTIILNFNTTVSDWRCARDLMRWRPLSHFLNAEFNLSLSEEQWKSVLTPARKRTLREVCELIANHCSFPTVTPVRLLGNSCLSAAVFITLKKYLARRGVQVDELKPSTPIGPYLHTDFSAMIKQIGILARGNKVFEVFDYASTSHLNKPFLHLFTTRVALETGSILTFRDVVEKIIAVNDPYSSPKS
ncbi:hypothetical protein [Myroides odoratus]|uniref:Uncharacterized protein n=1 Tax=Myroides odoratus TaxID=256 RepID=A0A9Q6ZCL0_MYROD|nr:hypothetical protein [Myroides odoratus]EHQ43913.1 hypothetical protein Myrod_3095 [Myroides odoratus DSM 2801]EKB04970.1 hypothetical protein HMPREF9716_03001 [Myroides odoratus CIP 103059]QQU01215.1 hypothetical protein I6I88_05545 [Myroides odoratus]WQD56527.1 hypothetical protein U0010_13485 [Myroides odoratus]STZ31189.1 Uncharacterised protein [Myroides odoratus]